MSNLRFYAALALIILSGIGGILLGASTNSAPGELDKICYEHNPDWNYKLNSALYWNDTLSINCMEEVEVEKPLGNTTEKQVQATLQLREVEDGIIYQKQQEVQ